MANTTTTKGMTLEEVREIQFHTPPENQGQIVTYSYAYCENGILEHCYDGSDREESYALYEDPLYESEEENTDPWSGVPELGEEIWTLNIKP